MSLLQTFKKKNGEETVNEQGNDSLLSGISPYYAALIEFHQENGPVEYWRYGEPPLENTKDLHWAIISVQAIPDSLILDPSLTVICSSYLGIHYVANYISIPDTKARGFSRVLCFFVANRSKVLINSLFHSNEHAIIRNLVTQMFNNALERFRIDVAIYAQQLRKAVSSHSTTHPHLINLEEEVKPYLRKLNVLISDSANEEIINPNDFISVGVELQSIKEITKFDSISHLLTKVLKELDEPYISRNIRLKRDSTTNHSMFCFLKTFDNCCESGSKYKLLPIVKSTILPQIIYSLMAGRTFVIESKDYSSIDLMSFVYKFCIFVPGFKENCIARFSEEKTIDSIIQYSIVIVPSLIRNSEFEENVAILNTDQEVFEGPICSPKSAIFNSFDVSQIKTEYSALLALIEIMTSFSTTNSLKMCDLLELPKEKMLKSVIEFKCETEDDQMFKYRMLTMLDVSEKRIVVEKIPAISGIGFIPYYSHLSTDL